jgi:hypothetical protein
MHAASSYKIQKFLLYKQSAVTAYYFYKMDFWFSIMITSHYSCPFYSCTHSSQGSNPWIKSCFTSLHANSISILTLDTPTDYFKLLSLGV